MHTNIRKNGHKVSAFRNIYAKEKEKDIQIEEFINSIRKGDFKDLVEEIRKEQSKEEKNKQKNKASSYHHFFCCKWE